MRPEFECQNRISNVKMGYAARIRMSKLDFECRNAIFGPSLNFKIGFRMSKCDRLPEFEWQNRILNSKMRYSTPVRMSKKDFESCQNAIIGPNLNVKVGFRMSKCDIRPEFECRKTKNEKQPNFTFNRPYSLKIGTFSHFQRL